jgi:hypothetical protein
MYARSTTFRARPAAIDDGIAFLRDDVMPAAMAMSGCTGLSMMVDRRSGRCIATTGWDTADHMRASAGLIDPMRDRAAAIMSAAPFVEEWEIASVHRLHTSHDGACVRATWMWLEPAMVDHAIDTYRRGRCRRWRTWRASAARACSSIASSAVRFPPSPTTRMRR